MSVLLPNGRAVFFDLKSSTSFLETSTEEYYYIDSSESVKVTNYLPDDYLTLLQVGDETCIVYSNPINIELIEVQI